MTNKINDLSKGVDLGGAFASNSRFLSGAIKTLAFHSNSDACTCALFGLHDCMNPYNEVAKGFLKIDNIVRIEDNWVDYYKASCMRCSQKFKIEEQEGHYMGWKWESLTELYNVKKKDKVVNSRAFSPLQLSCNLTGKCHTVGY